MQMLTIPHFDSEADEAKWWFENQDLVAAEYDRAKPSLSSSAAKQRLMEVRAKRTFEEKNGQQPILATTLPKSA
jgi:hypothetical protein